MRAVAVRDVGFATILAVLMILSRQFVLPGSDVAVLWPAAGVSLLWLHECLPSRRRIRSALLLVFTLTVLIRLVTGGDPGDSALIGLGHTVQAWVGARLLAQWDEPLELRRPADLTRLLVVVVVGAVAGLIVAGPALWVLPVGGHHLGWLIAWAVRNAAGAFVVTALGLLLRRADLRACLREFLHWRVHIAIALLVVGLAAFDRFHVPLAFTVLPVLAWMALRVRTLTALSVTGVVSMIVLVADINGKGPYSTAGPAIQVLYLQLVFAVFGSLVLTLSLYRDQRDRLLAQLELAHSQTRSRADRLEQQTGTDPLTGLANRRGLLAGMRRGPLKPGACGLLYLDLDRFKPVNDQYGHAAGDRVLVEVADRLTQHVRSTDLVARIGGDEFVVFCRGITGPALHSLAARLVAAIGEPIRIGPDEVGVEGSVGVALTRPDDDADSLLARADQAMYQAKYSANRHAVFS